jgi:hypothetical protein
VGTPVGSPLAVQALSAVGPPPAPNDFARVQIANEPPPGLRGECAEKVAARITFRTQDGDVLLAGMLGRWAETPQRIERGRLGLSLEETQLDIDANGVPHPVDVAMKAIEDAQATPSIMRTPLPVIYASKSIDSKGTSFALRSPFAVQTLSLSPAPTSFGTTAQERASSLSTNQTSLAPKGRAANLTPSSLRILSIHADLDPLASKLVEAVWVVEPVDR